MLFIISEVSWYYNDSITIHNINYNFIVVIHALSYSLAYQYTFCIMRAYRHIYMLVSTYCCNWYVNSETAGNE